MTREIQFFYAIVFALLGLLILTLGCQSAGSSSAESARTAQEQPGRTLRVATSGDYPPFSDWPADAPSPIGFSIAVAEAFAEDSGASVEWIRFRWPELATDLAENSFDFAISGITVRADRSILGRFGIPLTTSGAVVLVRADSSFETTSDLDQPSIRMAVNAGGHLEKVARRLFPKARIEAIPKNAAVLGQLLEGIADAVVTDSVESTHWQQASTIELREIGPLTRDRKAAWFPPGNELGVEAEVGVDRFNQWLLAAESSGQLARLRQQYGLAKDRTASPLPALLSSLNERLSLMKAVAEAKRVLDAPIENPKREEIVLEAAVRSVQAAAGEAELDPPDLDAVRRLFRAQIEAAKWIQINHLAEESTKSVATNATDRALARTTLNQVLRPALIHLGDRISMLIPVCAADPQITLGPSDVDRALESHHLPEKHLREIYEALSEIVIREKSVEPRPRPSSERPDITSNESGQTTHP